MGSQKQLHVVFFPLMAPGHMIPMLDIAKLFASRGVKCTVLTTPANARHVQAAAYRSVHLHLLQFRSPEGSPLRENLATSTGQDDRIAFFKSLALLRPPFVEALRDLDPVDAVVSDMFFPWTFEAAKELGIPRISFHGTGLFALCANGVVSRHKLFESAGENVFFPSGFPHTIELPRSEVMDPTRLPKEIALLIAEQRAADACGFGVVVNSFHDLEPGYSKYYREVLGCKNWVIGPVSLCNEDELDKAARGAESADDPTNKDLILQWLDSKRARSVLYLCFGSLSSVAATQLTEIALYLKQAEHPFIWVIKEHYSTIDGLLMGELEEKGLVIRGWAPQILILNHEAVGGFVTHCGWNSCLEAVSAGVPMVTWPSFADQFYNQKLVLDVLSVGVGVGVTLLAAREEERVLVKAEEIRRAVDGVMDGGYEAESRRRRARELSMMAKRAMEPGGSSYEDLGRLIDQLISTSRLERAISGDELAV